MCNSSNKNIYIYNNFLGIFNNTINIYINSFRNIYNARLSTYY